MTRVFRTLVLFVLAGCFAGCGDSTPPPPTGDALKAAQAEAAKMPPPPKPNRR